MNAAVLTASSIHEFSRNLDGIEDAQSLDQQRDFGGRKINTNSGKEIDLAINWYSQWGRDVGPTT